MYAGDFQGMPGFNTTVIVAKWMDAKPSTKAACESATASLYLYKDDVRFSARTVKGVWDAPGVKGCTVPTVKLEIPIVIILDDENGDPEYFIDPDNEGHEWRAAATARTSAAGPTRKLQIYPYGKDL